jgi:hypothetical protein
MAWRGGFDGHCYSKDDFTKYVATISGALGVRRL